MVAASDDVNGDSGSCERVDLTAAAHILDHINFDLLSPDEVKKHACALADRYKLLLEECDNENATVKDLRRKLKALESEKVSFSSKYTDEICELLSENTVLKSKLERLEADKQQTEFTSISKVQTVSSELKERSDELATTFKALEDIREELSAEIVLRKETEDRLKMTQAEFCQKEEVLRNKIDCLASENHTLSTERGALCQKVADQNNLIKSLELKVDDLSKDLLAMKKNWEKTQDEFDNYALCSDEKLSQVVGRAEALENKLKSEVTEKHRMTEKTEKITTQLTDLIKTYESCKHETNQLRKELEDSNNEKVVLQSELQSSKFEVDEMRAQLEEYNQNFLSINSELNQAIIRQREFEQTYGDPMKDLEAVLLQHAQVESSRGNTAAGKSGQSLPWNGGPNQAGGRRTQERALARSSSKKKKNDVLVPTKESSGCTVYEKDFASSGEGSNLESVSPAELVQGIASLMKQYSAQVEAGRAENGALLDRLKAVNVEVTSYKEALEHNKQILDEVKEQLASKAHELQKMKREKCEMEQKINAAHEDGKQLADFGEKQKTRANRLADQITLFRKKAKLDDETKKKQVLLVFNKIVAARRISTGKSNQESNPETNANLSEVSEWELIFSNLVENLELFLNSYKQCLEKSRDLEFNCLRKDEAMDEMSANHESELNSLKAKFSHQYQSITSEALRNEQHYQDVVEELQQKLKDAQKWAEDSSEKIEMLQNLRTSQEIEIGELKQLLLKSQNNAQSFQLALCLLCGVLWPVFGRLNAIICQQRMLISSYEDGQNVCKQISKLAAAVNGERDDWDTEGSSRGPLQRQLGGKLHPLLRFRKGVICVLAANRLVRLSNQSSLCFTVHDLVGGPNCRLSVSMGRTNGTATKDNVNAKGIFVDEFESNNNVRKTKKKGQSKMRNSGEEVTQLRNQKEKIQDQQLAMLNWLLDSGFSYKVTTSLADLLSFVQNNTVDAEGNQKQLKGILTQSRNSFIQLISRLSQHFENTSASIGESAASPYERPSLAQSLLKGLHSAMVRLPADKRAVYVPVQHNLAAVQNALIDLSEKVSTYEEEKALLNQELLKLRSENNHLLAVKDRATMLQEQLDTLKKQSENMVSRDKYNKVCTELDGALLREKQAEDLLREQGEQLLSLGKQLEAKHRDESSRELSLAESARELCETKLELSKRTHEMRGLSRKLEELQVEKSKLQQSATHADISARCAVRDGDLVCCYVKTVNNAVENFKNQLIYSPSTVNSLMLPQLEEVVSGNMKLSEEIKCCHELVSNFGETLAHLTTQMHNQTNQIRLQRNNIAALKQELLASTKPQILVGNDYSAANGNKNAQSSRPAIGLSSTPDSDYGGSSSATMFGVDPLQSYSSQLSSILRQPRTSSSEHHQEQLPNNRPDSRNSTQSIARVNPEPVPSKIPHKPSKAKGSVENKMVMNSAPAKNVVSRRR